MDEHKLNRFAVIGNPVSQSQSPKIHQAFAKQFGIELSYEKIHVEQEDFNQVVKDFFAKGGLGLNITTPYKASAAQLVERCSSMAKLSQSVNTVFVDQQSNQLKGESTDGLGWLRDAQRLKINLVGSKILIIGAGGAARIILNQLLMEEIETIHVCNRTESRAEQLVTDRVSASNLDKLPDTSWDLIINTLSVGWQGEYPNIKVQVGPQCSAYDLNYGQGAAAFKQWFIESSGQDKLFYDGWGMLVEQAAESFNLWWKKKPNTQALIEEGPS